MPKTKHGHNRKSKTSPTYYSWVCMKTRCGNPNSDSYKWYGAKGITVCDRWKDSFTNFLVDMGERPKGMTLDRIDTNGNYEPSNCRWETEKVQHNNKNSNHLITYQGKTQSVSQWAEELNINVETLFTRIHKLNWSVEKAFTTPVKKRKRLITYQGKTQSIADWAREVGIKRQTLNARLIRGLSIEKALTIPV